MRVKSAQAGEGRGCTPTTFTISTITYNKVILYATAERADTLFLFYPFMYSVRGTGKVKMLLVSKTPLK
jgi:hypothetical protein